MITLRQMHDFFKRHGEESPVAPVLKMIDPDFEDEQAEKDPEEPKPKMYSSLYRNAAVERARKDAHRAAKQEFQCEFAERERLASQQRIVSFCQDGLESGLLKPAWVESGIIDFMEHLSAKPEPIQFAEHADRQSPLDFFQDLLVSIKRLHPKH